MGGGRLEGETIYLRPIAMEDTERIVTWRTRVCHLSVNPNLIFSLILQGFTCFFYVLMI